MSHFDCHQISWVELDHGTQVRDDIDIKVGCSWHGKDSCASLIDIKSKTKIIYETKFANSYLHKDDRPSYKIRLKAV